MNAINKIVTPISAHDAVVRATYALTLAKKIATLTAELEDLKKDFRDYGQAITVEGLGKVTYRSSSGGVPVPAHTKIEFNEMLFHSLPEGFKQKLYAKGVTKMTFVADSKTPIVAAGIGFKLNV